MFAHRFRKSICYCILLCALFIFVAKIENPKITVTTIDETEKHMNDFLQINRQSSTQQLNSTYMVNGHCVMPNVVARRMKEDPERITLILHVSFNKLDSSIERQISNWDGPISLAVVFPPKYSLKSEEALCTAKFLKNLQRHHYDSLLKLSAHFLFRDRKCAESDVMDNDILDYANCTNPSVMMPSDYEQIIQMAKYPVNEARNLARNLSSTNYILIADMDHLFSKNFEAKMISLAKKTLTKDPKTVLVYRIFEVMDNVTKFPETKKDLLTLYNEEKAQVFHKHYGAHSIVGLSSWFDSLERPENDTAIQLYIPYKYHHWEPQFVSLRTIPFHDTAFFYPIRDNTVLRWEMCRAGFKFAVVDDVFMFHPGIKTSEGKNLINEVRMLVKQKTVHCPDEFSPPCEINGYIGYIKSLTVNDNASFIEFMSSNSVITNVAITDVRPSATAEYKHQLGVCLQPIYLMTDYSLFIQFFEYWLSEGATKFYIYWESFTHEIRDIIDFYKSNSNADIELVEWSKLPNLPEMKENFYLDPNSYWFRLEVLLSIFDCMHRARYHVKYVAQSDLDEIFHVQNMSLLDYLENANNEFPELVDVQFRSQKVSLTNGNFFGISTISNFSFVPFENVIVDRRIFEKPLYVKMIHRPERDVHVRIHQPNRPELILGRKFKQYEHIDADPKIATVWHFRRVNDTYRSYDEFISTDLATNARKWEKNFRFRISMSNLETQFDDEELIEKLKKRNPNRPRTVVNRKDLEKIEERNSDLLPKYSAFDTDFSNPEWAKTICIGNDEKRCGGKLKQLDIRLKSAPAYKTLACIIHKNMSTILEALMCFLFNEQKFRQINYVLSQECENVPLIFDRVEVQRFCSMDNDYKTLEKAKELFNLAHHEINEWLYLAIVRDPIDRFLSGYVDKCIRKYDNSSEEYCNGCQGNITCFIITEYEKVMENSLVEFPIRNFDNYHFFPQTWRCNFETEMQHYKLLHYSSAPQHVEKFVDDLINLLRIQKVPEDSLQFIKNQITGGRTTHSTITSDVRLFFEERVYSNPFLLEYIIRMFYWDYKLLGFELPTF